ncbi:MAG TPA: hypothetical protein VM783_16155 [Candidatus Acidoferrum sp.]|jgi:hypothetical protein|nr:hypothetical protein [Candidatus Acidoferrum sp.]
MKVSSCAVALYLKLDKTNTCHCRPKKDAALVCLSEFSKLKLDKAGKTADVRVQKRWIFLTGIGSLGKVGKNGIQQFSFCNLTTEWSHFATTICRYVFESVKSTG